MDTYLVYFDETGDDGLIRSPSNAFILTSIYLNSNVWQNSFDKIKVFRKELKEKYNFHITEEIHTKALLTGKEPYGKYHWTDEQIRDILLTFAYCIASLQIKSVNVVIDKTKIKSDCNYHILENALKYNIQRIENDSNNLWNYLIMTDKGRISSMRRTAREIRQYNPIPSKFTQDFSNKPIKGMIEDILEKDSSESYFIQICDFISYFVHLYYQLEYKNQQLPNRVSRSIDKDFITRILNGLNKNEIFNIKASKNEYGIAIYPK